MTTFFKQLFTKNEWIHLHQMESYSKDSISDFGIIALNFVSTFLIGWAVSQKILFGLSIGLVFAILAMIKCYYEFRKSRRIPKKIL